MPSFATITELIKRLFDEVEPNTGGHNATYIPQLAEVDPDQFAISITTTDG